MQKIIGIQTSAGKVRKIISYIWYFFFLQKRSLVNTLKPHISIVYFSEILTQNSIKCGNIHARRTNGIEIELCNFIFLNRTKIIFSRAMSQKRTNKVNMLHMIQQKWSSIQSTIFSMHSILRHKTISLNFQRRIGILLPKLI